MGSHERYSTQSEWYTPEWVFVKLGVRFDMDVAAAPDGLGVVPADLKTRDAFNTRWVGFVWCNPPFAGRGNKQKWIDFNSDHGNGILLTPDRSSTSWWQDAARKADAMLMVSGKIKFVPGPGNPSNGKQPGSGTTLFAFGDKAVDALMQGQRRGLGICLFSDALKLKQKKNRI